MLFKEAFQTICLVAMSIKSLFFLHHSHVIVLSLIQNNGTELKCFEQDDPKVKIGECFTGGYCYDKQENQYKEAQIVTSCCECLVYVLAD